MNIDLRNTSEYVFILAKNLEKLMNNVLDKISKHILSQQLLMII